MEKTAFFDAPWPEAFYLPMWDTGDGWSTAICGNIIYAAESLEQANLMIAQLKDVNSKANQVVEGTKVGEAAWTVRWMSRRGFFRMLKEDPPPVPVQFVATRFTDGQQLVVFDLSANKRALQ